VAIGTNWSCSPCQSSTGVSIAARSKPHGLREREIVVEPAVDGRLECASHRLVDVLGEVTGERVRVDRREQRAQLVAQLHGVACKPLASLLVR
jgi:hypothetical protein